MQTTALLSMLFTLVAPVFCSAEVPCGIQSLAQTVLPVYPPIARAAHVSGIVLLLATFDTAGKVAEVHTTSGPQMLQASAEAFVKGWQANAYSGPRSCPVVVDYKLAGGTYCTDDEARIAHIEPSTRVDTQHFVVSAYALALCDPAATITRRKRFGIF